MFAADRDLLVLEPMLFRDYAWLGQTLIASPMSSGGSLVEIVGDADFELAGVTAGHVLTVIGSSFEILDRAGATEVIASTLRADRAAPPIPLPAFTEQNAYVMTFAPQIDLVHRRILRAAGIEPDAAPPPGEPGVLDILNTRELARLEALGALALIYTAAIGPAPAGPIPARAEFYRRRFEEARERTLVHFDLDADGVADLSRHLSTVATTRA